MDEITSDVKEILSKLYGSVERCGRFFFPDHFQIPRHAIHVEIDNLLEKKSSRKIAIAAPRGVGKTTRLIFGRIAPDLLFQDVKFVVYITNTASNAILHSENLKSELSSNELVRKLFGQVKPAKVDSSDMDESFSKEAWVTNWGTLILPRGAGQQVRGILYRGRRPDLIIFDDLEDSEAVQSEDQRKKLKTWFYGDVLKCVTRYDDNWRFIYIDTLKHEDSLLQELLDSDEWDSVRLEACDDDLNPTAPEYMDKEELVKEYEEHRKKGQEDTFYREFRNIAISTRDAVFLPSYFKRFSVQAGLAIPEEYNTSTPEVMRESASKISQLVRVVIVDPAKTVKLHSAESAIICEGIDTKTGRIFVLDCESGKMYPDELYKRTLEMVSRNSALILGIEVTSLNEFIIQPIKNEINKLRLGVIFHALNARGKKEERIAALAPYYRQGEVYHNPQVCHTLEQQLKFFPRSKRMDVMDAHAYVIKIMSDLDIYFEGDESDYEDLYDEEYEDPVDYELYV